HEATFGSVHRPQPLKPSLLKRASDAIASGSLQPLRATSGGMTQSGGDPLVLWVSEKDVSNLGSTLSQIRDLEIHLPGGQILMGRSGGSGSHSAAGGVWELGSFSVVPWRDKELDVRFTMNGEAHRLVYQNPAYRPNLPAWKPQELPITWKGDGFVA